ncbi:pilus assembly protein [Flexivirga sp. ID2601S]|uniref:Pilus assembly protein n=1 Tax=Flexivirga aerilata TaxID=1656889 RepID=A0A849AIQ1_9MICO|nr:pilus assembly protein [Flexivirga aerilata]NNG39211.1 pilus assembly protein [Flexivirga aerilata]
MIRNAFRHTCARVRRRVGDGERGSALVEFIVIGVLLTLPVFYLVITLARLQAGTYAVAAAARESSRMFVTAPSDAAGATRSQAAAALAFRDQGFGGQGSVRVACTRSPCLSPDGTIDSAADLDVPLPLIPDFLRGAVPSSVHLHSRHAESVDRYRAPGTP